VGELRHGLQVDELERRIGGRLAEDELRRPRPMAKYLSDEYFSQVQVALAQDAKWAESTKSFKTSLGFGVTDIGQFYVVSVDNGVTTVQKVAPGAPSEFSFEGTYDSWCKVARGEVDIQAAVLKGQLKFKGSITKIMMYRDKLNRVADVMKQVPAEL
jgi:putative sterol carrier protein